MSLYSDTFPSKVRTSLPHIITAGRTPQIIVRSGALFDVTICSTASIVDRLYDMSRDTRIYNIYIECTFKFISKLFNPGRLFFH